MQETCNLLITMARKYLDPSSIFQIEVRLISSVLEKWLLIPTLKSTVIFDPSIQCVCPSKSVFQNCPYFDFGQVEAEIIDN